jgi:hypothetical protein
MSKHQKDYYVYTHSTEERGIFYVGKGTKYRTKLIHRKHNPYHTNIVNKYGIENIIVSSILCRDEQHAFDLEVRMIAALRNGGVKLTNMSDGGEGNSGHVPSDETKAKISAGNLGHVVSEETRAKISEANTGRIQSEETLAKLSIIRTGRKHTEETKAKISKSTKGIKKSDETRAKMSARTLSEEHKAKISSSSKGKPKSDEHKSKIRIANTGKKHTDEARANMSEAAKLRCEKRKLAEVNVSLD